MIDWASLATFVSVCCAATAGLLHTVQQSRCTNIRMCCGFFECARNVPDVEPNDDDDATTPAPTSALESGATDLRIRRNI